LLITPSDRRGVGFSAVFVCLSVRLSVFPHVFQKPAPNLTEMFQQKSGNPFIFVLKGQRSRSRGTKTVPAWFFALIAGFF